MERWLNMNHSRHEGSDICSICKDLDRKGPILRNDAPELLKALKLALSRLTKHYSTHDEFMKHCADIIAKAEGKT